MDLNIGDSIRQLGLEGLRHQGMRAVIRAAGVHTVRELAAKARRSLELPQRLQFRLRGFSEHQSTDDLLQGGSDEVYLSGIGTDSAAVTLGPDEKPTVDLIRSGMIGDVSDDAVRNPWQANPQVLLEFDLKRSSDWPRSFVVTLLIVEEDNGGDLAKTFADVEESYGTAVQAAVATAALGGAAALTSALAAGTAIGSVIPGIGNLVGAAVGAAAVLIYDGIIKTIEEGLADEAFTPIAIELRLDDPGNIRQHPSIGPALALNIKEHGAHYALDYDWHLVD